MPRSKRFRLASDPNAPLSPEQMTLEALRDSILQDLERLRATGVLDLPQLPQGLLANPKCCGAAAAEFSAQCP
jgi:hypothetical protein